MPQARRSFLVMRSAAGRSSQRASSPVKAPPVVAHQANSGAWPLVTSKVPSPRENATGIVFHPAPPVSAMSVRPSPLKSPVSRLTRQDARGGSSQSGEGTRSGARSRSRP